MRGGRRPLIAVAVVVLMLAACASRPPVLPAVVAPGSGPLELADTPFFAQQDYQCGPAALASVLRSAGVEVLPEALVDQVFVPARQGSLQVEMLAATRRAGRIPYVIDPSLAALLRELHAGRPVLVLQNLGLDLIPVWHYAVVIGIDPGRDEIILRSGTERRRLSPARDFLRTWQLADAWAMVALRPGEMPAEVDRQRYLHALALTEAHLPPAPRRAAYRAALARWPDSVTAQFGEAFALHAAGDLQAAERAYRQLVADHPRHAAAFNNLAEVLAADGCHAQARAAAGRALAIARNDAPGLLEAIEDTLRQIPPLPDRRGCRPLNPR